MSYQRKLKPRFYADVVAGLLGRGISDPWTADSGTVNADSDLLELSDGMPKVRCLFDTDASATEVVLEIDLGSADHSIDAVAILNHNLNASGVDLEVRYNTADDYGAASVASSYTNQVGDVTSDTVDNDGSNLIILASQVQQNRYWWIRLFPTGATFTDDIEIGQICLLRQWTAPHGPDMDGSRPLDFGVRLQQTLGGGHNAVVDWVTGSDTSTAPFGQPFRYDHDGTTNDKNRLAGRRRWEHRLSLIDDDDFFTQNLEDGIPETGSLTLHTLLSITDGPRHPFIFTPDSASTTTGDYMWARFLEAEIAPEENSQHVLSVELVVQEEF